MTNTKTYSPFTIEATCRIIKQYKQYIKPSKIKMLVLMIEAESNLKLRFDLAVETTFVARGRFAREPAKCKALTIPYTEQGMLVSDSRLVFKTWCNKIGDMTFYDYEMYIEADGKPVSAFMQSYCAD